MLAKRRLVSPECAAVDEDKLLSRKELAAALGVSTRTVDRWIHEQTGPPATLLPSGRRRWRWGDVEAWLRQRREDGRGYIGLQPTPPLSDLTRPSRTPIVLVNPEKRASALVGGTCLTLL